MPSCYCNKHPTKRAAFALILALSVMSMAFLVSYCVIEWMRQELTQSRQAALQEEAKDVAFFALQEAVANLNAYDVNGGVFDYIPPLCKDDWRSHLLEFHAEKGDQETVYYGVTSFPKKDELILPDDDPSKRLYFNAPDGHSQVYAPLKSLVVNTKENESYDVKKKRYLDKVERHYAYWIERESLKANVNAPVEKLQAHGELLAYPKGAGIEIVEPFSSEVLPDYDFNETMYPNPPFYSYGVLRDEDQSRPKYDLTHYFNQPDNALSNDPKVKATQDNLAQYYWACKSVRDAELNMEAYLEHVQNSRALYGPIIISYEVKLGQWFTGEDVEDLYQVVVGVWNPYNVRLGATSYQLELLANHDPQWTVSLKKPNEGVGVKRGARKSAFEQPIFSDLSPVIEKADEPVIFLTADIPSITFKPGQILYFAIGTPLNEARKLDVNHVKRLPAVLVQEDGKSLVNEVFIYPTHKQVALVNYLKKDHDFREGKDVNYSISSPREWPFKEARLSVVKTVDEEERTWVVSNFAFSKDVMKKSKPNRLEAKGVFNTNYFSKFPLGFYFAKDISKWEEHKTSYNVRFGQDLDLDQYEELKANKLLVDDLIEASEGIHYFCGAGEPHVWYDLNACEVLSIGQFRHAVVSDTLQKHSLRSHSWLWDRCYLSSLEQGRILNRRLKHSKFDSHEVSLDPKSILKDFFVEGPFNVNTRSADSWKAFLGGLIYEKEQGNQAVMLGESFTVTCDTPSLISPGDLSTLSNLIVNVLNEKERPYKSLEAFVDDNVFQTALDQYYEQTEKDRDDHNISYNNKKVTQEDILQAVGPFLCTRSDTLKIHTYADVKRIRSVFDEFGQEIKHESSVKTFYGVLTEALVQRMVDGEDSSKTHWTILAVRQVPLHQ